MSNKVIDRYNEVLGAIHSKLAATGKPKDSVLLVAVSKTHSAEIIKELYSDAKAQGIPVVVGESYVQEFKAKRTDLPEDLTAHFIGHLQRNKAKDAVKLFSVIESVDSAELASALNKEAAKIGKCQEIYLQVNISGDPNKGGFSPTQVATFIEEKLPKLLNIKVTGLMTITAFYDVAEDARPDFRALRELRDSLSGSFALSMGMSSDYLIAIEEGATVVRVGTAIFGQRQ